MTMLISWYGPMIPKLSYEETGILWGRLSDFADFISIVRPKLNLFMYKLYVGSQDSAVSIATG
jgi:hypothetical protein